MTLSRVLYLTLFLLLSSFIAFANDDNSVIPPEIDNSQYISLWNFSGYTKILAEIPTDGRKAKAELDDLSIYVSGNINKWFNPFVEAEFFGGTLWQKQGGGSLNDGNFIFERLYNDFNINRNDRIRVGKFLAPVGFWNLIHAAPLVWTVNRPVSSTYSYSNYITGIEYGHLVDAISGSRIDFYLQLTDEFNPKPLSSHPRRYNKIFGGSWTLADDLDSRSSLDFQYAQVKISESERLTVSFQKAWYLQSWDFETQIIYTKIKNNHLNFIGVDEDNTFIEKDDSAFVKNGWDGGGYVQARYRLNSTWNFYARAEYFHYAIEAKSGRNYIFGSRYRLSNWGNINIEYKQGSGVKNLGQDGISISYNAMFR
ncbi:MAG: hypothetical protein JKX78_15430 [Alteromonadaceae bacterium]|nr:hypothetical protein [Alteromonadaceae bacterium]